MIRFWATAAVGGLTLLVGACGGDDGSAAEPSSEAPGSADASDEGQTVAAADGSDSLYGPVCDLLTAADVEAVLGASAQLNADDEDLGACHYALGDGTTVVTFQVQPGSAFDTNVEAFGEAATFEDVSGVGDRAAWSADVFVGGFLVTVAGDRSYSVSGAGTLEASTELLEQALSRA